MKLSAQKIENFQFNIRQEFREKQKKQIRRLNDSYLQISQASESLIQLQDRDKIQHYLRTLQSLLRQVQVGQMPISISDSLKFLVSKTLPNIMGSDNHSNIIAIFCKSILCLLTQSQDLSICFREQSILELIKQLTKYYLAPNHQFYQCMTALSNLLTIQAEHKIEDLTYQLLKMNNIEDIICTILAIRNAEWQSIVQFESSQYFTSQDQQEMLIWFLYKFLKLQSIKQQQPHTNLSSQLQIYLRNIFSLFSGKDTYLSDFQLNLYKYACKIIALQTFYPCAHIANEMTKMMLDAIEKNIREESSAVLWKSINFNKMWKIQNCQILIAQILEEIKENGEYLVTTRRDKNYLLGIQFHFYHTNQQYAIQIWEDHCQKQVQAVWERQDLKSRLQSIEKLLDCLKNEAQPIY